MGAFTLGDFHPDKHDTGRLEDAWREQLFGDAGQLRGRSARELGR